MRLIFNYIVRALVALTIISRDRDSQPSSSFDSKFIFELVFEEILDEISQVASVSKTIWLGVDNLPVFLY